MLCRPTIPSFLSAETWNTHIYFFCFGPKDRVVECWTPEREVGGSKPTAAVLCPWARHFTPRKYWLITQEAVAPSRHDWKIVEWDVKPQHKQTNQRIDSDLSLIQLFVCCLSNFQAESVGRKRFFVCVCVCVCVCVFFFFFFFLFFFLLPKRKIHYFKANTATNRIWKRKGWKETKQFRLNNTGSLDNTKTVQVV